MTWQQETDAVRGLRQALQHPVEQIRTDAEGRTLWRTAGGEMWAPKGAGINYVTQVAVEMRANVYDLSFLKTATRPAIVLDCGANIGYFARYALEAGVSRVVAFEPSPGNADCLRLNTAADAAKVTIVQEGVWDREDTLCFSTKGAHNPGGHHVTDEAHADIRIPVTTIDQVVERLGLSYVDYIKMDVEGAESKAIAGARETIRRFKPIMSIATEHTSDLFQNTLDVIEAVQKVDSSYEYLCTEAHPYTSPSRGRILTPFSLLFTAGGRRGRGEKPLSRETEVPVSSRS
ncbi:MAG: FkbM family methyltransferase [Bryobacteraceae bacterium]|nr:FkbM family methyltransferase [Bryobacteraceae bacterium]